MYGIRLRLYLGGGERGEEIRKKEEEKEEGKGFA